MQSYLSRVTLALLIALPLTACGQSGPDIRIQPVPPLDPALARPCADPGVAADAVVALVRTRQAWATCAARHREVVEAWPAN